MNRIIRQALATLVLIVATCGTVFGQATLLPDGRQQYLNNTGAPLAGGKVYFYIPNTSTAKATWQNSTQTIQNANPVILDGAGRATIYGAGSYRQVVQTSTGTTIWDNVTASTGGVNTVFATDSLPVGSLMPFTGLTAPTNWLFSNGAAISRVTFAELMNLITIVDTATSCTIGSPTVGMTSTVNIKVGAPIEATCLPAGTTVAAVLSSISITTSANAGASGTVTARVFPYGAGNGSTTFNLPNMAGRAPVGKDDAATVLTASFCTGAAGAINLGSSCGTQSHTLLSAELAAHTHTSPAVTDPGHAHTYPATSGNLFTAGAVPGINQSGSSTTNAATTGITLAATTGSTGSGTAFSVVQPVLLVNYIIKYHSETANATGFVSGINGMIGSIACGSGMSCSGNIISATGLFADPLPIVHGGTNATTASDARTNLGLGTIATQDASAVSITGGTITSATITGLASPTSPSDAANKAYVDASAAGLTVHTPVRLTTAAVLPNTPTYANGALGVGATLTAGSNTTLTVDGTVAALNDRVLVKNQAAPAQNGAYLVTTAGSGAAAWVLTRATDFDVTGEMTVGSYFLTTAGSANVNASFTLQATVPTVGTDPVTFVQFGASPSAISSVNIIAGSSLATTGTCNSTTSISCTLSVSLGGSTGNVQYNNGGVLGGLTDTQLTARITPLNNTFTGTNIFKGDTFLGSGSPWVDVKSGANGCPAAAGNGVTPDQSAIQCQLNYIHNTLTTGVLYMPLGIYLIQSGLTVYEGTTVQGVGMGANATFATLIQTSGDFTALSFVGGSNAWNGVRDVYVQCSQSTSATQNCVFVDNNTPTIISNVRILGGYRALATHGVDGRYYNVFATAAATTSSSANLFSRGSNFYYGCKFDSSSAQDFGALIALPYASSTVPMENQFHGCDFSNSTAFASAAFAVDDGGNPGGRVALTKCFDCIFGASSVASLIVNNSLATLIVGSEAGSIQFNGPSTLGLSIYGSVAPGGAVAVSGVGSPRSCANLNITC